MAELQADHRNLGRWSGNSYS